MPSTIFSGSKVKTLKSTLSLNGGADVISSTVDPTSVAVDASPGSILLNTTSGKQYRKNDSGSSTNWTEVGAGTSGINYITNPSAATNTTGWTTYADAAGTAPVDGTGGSPTVTWTRSTTTPLRGAADFNFTKDAANRQGEGVATDITIDLADQAKVLTVSFDYEVLSGTYATGDLTVYLIADPSGTPVVIQPAGYQIQAATAGTKMRQIATFQTQATGQSYRVCFHVASTSASAYVLTVDNVVAGPQVVQYGSPITDWQSYSLSVTSTGSSPSKGSASTDKAFYRRVGDTLEIEYSLVCGTGASAGTGFYIFNLPSGYTIDSSKISTGASYSQSLFGSAAVTGATNFSGWVQAASGSTTGFYIVVGNETSTPTVVGQAFQPFTNGYAYSLIAKVPITGLSSTVQMSNDTDTRIVAGLFKTTNSSTAISPAGTYLITTNWTATIDTHAGFSSGQYRIPVSGFYSISCFFRTSGATATTVDGGFRVAVFVDGVENITISRDTADQITSARGFGLDGSSGTIALNAGQLVDVRIICANISAGATLSGTADQNYWSIQRLSGPSAIAASELIACSYNTSTSVITGSGAWSLVTYTNKVVDTHGIYNTSTGAATIPVSGTYRIIHQIRGKNVLVGGEYASVHFTKNGTTFTELMSGHVVAGATGATVKQSIGPMTWVGTLVAGDVIRFSMDSNSASFGPATTGQDPLSCNFSIQKL